MPLVWCISSVMVTVAPHGGSPETYWDRWSLSVNLLASTSSNIAAAVNCLVVEAMSKMVAALIDALVVRFAIPRAPVQTAFPSIPTAAEQPGAPASMTSSSALWLLAPLGSGPAVVVGGVAAVA